MATPIEKPPDMSPEEEEFYKNLDMDLFEIIEKNANTPSERHALAFSIMRKAKEGDVQALKMVQQALMDGKYKNEQKLIVTDGQLEYIITLAADRIRKRDAAAALAATN